jgi:hypothetical protein
VSSHSNILIRASFTSHHALLIVFGRSSMLFTAGSYGFPWLTRLLADQARRIAVSWLRGKGVGVVTLHGFPGAFNGWEAGDRHMGVDGNAVINIQINE